MSNGLADVPPHIFYFGSFSSYAQCEEACRQVRKSSHLAINCLSIVMESTSSLLPLGKYPLPQTTLKRPNIVLHLGVSFAGHRTYLVMISFLELLRFFELNELSEDHLGKTQLTWIKNSFAITKYYVKFYLVETWMWNMDVAHKRIWQ